jgi:hypothetical protein
VCAVKEGMKSPKEFVLEELTEDQKREIREHKQHEM